MREMRDVRTIYLWIHLLYVTYVTQIHNKFKKNIIHHRGKIERPRFTRNPFAEYTERPQSTQYNSAAAFLNSRLAEQFKLHHGTHVQPFHHQTNLPVGTKSPLSHDGQASTILWIRIIDLFVCSSATTAYTLICTICSHQIHTEKKFYTRNAKESQY